MMRLLWLAALGFLTGVGAVITIAVPTPYQIASEIVLVVMTVGYAAVINVSIREERGGD